MIESICKKYNIENYTINDDGTVDVNRSVDLSNKKLTKLPLKFRKVSGSFYCFGNNLTTLEGSPKFVGGDFHCYENKLTSLEGSPEVVGGWFQCYENKLTDLKGGPIKVGYSYICSDNNIFDLNTVIEEIGISLHCKGNPIGSISISMDIDFIRALNTFKVIKNKKVNLKRLRYIMEIFNLPINIEKIKQYYEID